MSASLLIIDNYDSFTFNLAQLFKQLVALETQVLVHRNDSLHLNEIRSIAPAAIIFSPGPGTPKDSGICKDVLQSTDIQVPILGVCLGHQLIGEHFGARLRRAKKPLHGKCSLIHHTASDIFAGLPSPLTVARYHSLAIDEIPEDLQILASDTVDGEVMALRHRHKPIWGVQFHPESFLTESGDRIIHNFLAHCL